MQNTERETVSRRVLWASAVFAGLLLAGVILFFLFADRAEPLVSSTPRTTTLVS